MPDRAPEPCTTARRAIESRAWLALPLAAVLLFTALAIDAARIETPTVDEFAHVPAGVAAWRQGRTDLYRSNPVLPKLLLAAPLALDAEVADPPAVEAPLGWGPWQYGARFLEANRAQYLDVMLRARLVAIACALAAAAILFGWARDVFGLRAASIVTALFLLCPNVLAHGHLATIDMAALTTILLALDTLRRAVRQPTPLRVLGAGAALGLALAIKFSAVLVVPAIAAVVVTERFRDPATPRPRRIGRAALDLACLALVALVVTNASLAFEGSFAPLAEFSLRSSMGRALVASAPGWVPVPLPREWVLGFDGALEIQQHGEFGSYLMGRWSEHGVWYYNLVALGVKLPLATLALVAVAVPCWWRRRGRDLLPIAAPLVALLVAFATASNLNIGIRHVLPVLPFLFLLLGPVFEQTSDIRWRRTSALLAVFALGAGLRNAASIHPNYLTFFNAIAGGPQRGGAWLLDSNLDWGQDLYRVRDAARAIDPDAPLYLLYFGHVDPALYGISYALVPPTRVAGLVAVSANFLGGASYVTVAPGGATVPVSGDTAAWLRGETPSARLGSILLFDTRPESPDAAR
jgi:hypothetical protein